MRDSFCVSAHIQYNGTHRTLTTTKATRRPHSRCKGTSALMLYASPSAS
jgi:hypothetical protein